MACDSCSERQSELQRLRVFPASVERVALLMRPEQVERLVALGSAVATCRALGQTANLAGTIERVVPKKLAYEVLDSMPQGVASIALQEMLGEFYG